LATAKQMLRSGSNKEKSLGEWAMSSVAVKVIVNVSVWHMFVVSHHYVNVDRWSTLTLQ